MSGGFWWSEVERREIERGDRAHRRLLVALDAAPLPDKALLEELWREDDDPPDLTVLDGGKP